jgi:glycogen debranching enzyme
MYTDREGRLRTLEDAHRAALAWIFRRMDENRDGFVESRSPLPGGIRNQVWKDSADAYHHADGGLADPARGVSSVEVQALVHDALRESAAMLRDGISCDAVTWWLAVECEHRAAELAASFHRVFWVGGDRPYLALGADRDARGRARPLCVRTSNMGHVLGSGLLEGPDGRDRAAAIAEVLGSREMLAAGGVRTLARGEARYRAGGYHVGSVWPWENALIARGLRAASRDDQARDLERRVLATCRETGMFPEFVRGDACRIAVNTQIVDEVDPQLGEVRMEQPPQQVQAWTVAAALDADHRIAAEERRAA